MYTEQYCLLLGTIRWLAPHLCILNFNYWLKCHLIFLYGSLAIKSAEQTLLYCLCTQLLNRLIKEELLPIHSLYNSLIFLHRIKTWAPFFDYTFFSVRIEREIYYDNIWELYCKMMICIFFYLNIDIMIFRFTSTQALLMCVEYVYNMVLQISTLAMLGWGWGVSAPRGLDSTFSLNIWVLTFPLAFLQSLDRNTYLFQNMEF